MATATNRQALQTLVDAIEARRLHAGRRVAIALIDIAASRFSSRGRYRLAFRAAQFDADGWIELLLRWIDAYPIASIEDPLAEDDLRAFARFTQAAGARLQIVGDDLLVSDAGLVRRPRPPARRTACCSKPNQRGTLGETLDAWRAAPDASYAGIVSARSSETEDTTIVHLAIGWQVGQLKVARSRARALSQVERALRIEAAGPNRALRQAARIRAQPG